MEVDDTPIEPSSAMNSMKSLRGGIPLSKLT